MVSITRRQAIIGLGGLGVAASDVGSFILGRYVWPHTSKPDPAPAPSSSGSSASASTSATQNLPFGKYWIEGIDIDGGTDPVTGAPRTTFVLLRMKTYNSADPDGSTGAEYDGVVRVKDMQEAQILDCNLRGKRIEIHSLPANSVHGKIGGGFIYELESRDFEIDNTSQTYRRTPAASPSRIPGTL